MVNIEGYVIENLLTIDGLRYVGDEEYVVTDLTLRTEVDVRVLTAGRTDVFEFDLLEGLLTGSSLLGLRSVSREAGDEFLQLLDLLFLLLIRFLTLLLHQSRRLVPEVVVTGIELDLAIVDVCDVGADLI